MSVQYKIEDAYNWRQYRFTGAPWLAEVGGRIETAGGKLTLLSTADILELLEAAAYLLRCASNTRLVEDKVRDEAVAFGEPAEGTGIARVAGLVLQESYGKRIAGWWSAQSGARAGVQTIEGEKVSTHSVHNAFNIEHAPLTRAFSSAGGQTGSDLPLTVFQLFRAETMVSATSCSEAPMGFVLYASSANDIRVCCSVYRTRSVLWASALL